MNPLSTLDHTNLCPELPNEILLLIIQACPGSTLKNVRLASKTLEQLATPVLWSKVVLIPNLECIRGFMEALERSKVLLHVTKLVYDARFGNFFYRIKTENPMLSFMATPGRDLSIEAVTQGRFQPYEDMAIEVAMLGKALRLLPNLRALRVREHEDSEEPGPFTSLASLKIPYFYQKMCKKYKVSLEAVKFSSMAGTPGRSYTKGILTAAYSSNIRLHSLKAMNVDARGMFGAMAIRPTGANHQLRLLRDVLQDLQELELGFRNDTLLPTANHIEAISFLLRSAKKLKRLKLRMTDCSLTRCQYTDDDLVSDLAALLETHTAGWTHRPLAPRLETLTLDACICHDQDLLHFLKLHGATLRHLNLSNITLLGGADRRECWVKVIKRFKTDLKLTSVSFSGWFTNGGRQQWFVATDNVDPNRLKPRVEKYVVDKRVQECPLDHVAIKPHLSDVEKPANGEEFEGDLTWTMVYANPLADNVDWQPTEPSFGGSSLNTSDPLSVSSPEDDLLVTDDATDNLNWSEDWDVEHTIHQEDPVILCTKEPYEKHSKSHPFKTIITKKHTVSHSAYTLKKKTTWLFDT
ncbi:hypothetical protein PV08_05711 [Exophiala spinifera]|uniref:Caspase family p20 domain-containing protein n=1 Tax=Exophiala spinifera TaxID=91928 RepID=A0A0D1ZS78_9EURO|nr:uncharacterized protein PV08_05711 [Exophiala spinifera]KIW15662.1 hypothetical protein PV08_05711 [Exophiala spinifera]